MLSVPISPKTNFTNTPNVTTDHHISTHQLIALSAGDKTNPIIQIVRISHHAVYPVFIVFLSVLASGDNKRSSFNKEEE